MPPFFFGVSKQYFWMCVNRVTTDAAVAADARTNVL